MSVKNSFLPHSIAKQRKYDFHNHVSICPHESQRGGVKVSGQKGVDVWPEGSGCLVKNGRVPLKLTDPLLKMGNTPLSKMESPLQYGNTVSAWSLCILLVANCFIRVTPTLI